MATLDTTTKRKNAAAKESSLEHRHRAQSLIDSKALDELETEVFETGLYENQNLSIGSRYGVMAAEVIYSYLWWSLFQSLVPVVWYYPLCAMEISGLEVVCFLWLSPVFLGFGPLRRFVTSPIGLMIMRVLTMMGVASYQAPDLFKRVVILSISNFFAMLVLAGSWWDKSKLDRHRHIYLHLLGFLLYLALRVWGSTFDLIFVDITYNSLATIMGIFLSIFLYIYDYRTPVVAISSTGTTTTAAAATTTTTSRGRYPGLISTAIGFGALMYLTQLIYGEVSVVTRMAVSSYPNHGPYPHPWGMVTMLAITVGLVIFGHQTDLLTSVSWTAVGLVFSMILYFTSTYTSFFGGLVLAIYTMSLWPLMAKRVINFPPNRVLPLALLVMTFYMLLSVWVVAYNFVPGGTLTRERSDVMLIMLVLSCGLGARNSAPPSEAKGQSERQLKRELRQKSSEINFVGGVIRRLSTVTEEGDEEIEETAGGVSMHQLLSKEVSLDEDKEAQSFHGKVLKAALIILLLTLSGFMYRIQGPPPNPQKEHPDVISAGIWAFHFGYDNTGWPSMERAATLLENSEMDVIGLVETDAARPYIGNHDIASWLSERLHMYADYGPGPSSHTWGVLILSKYPIIKSAHHLLPSPEGELAPGILATVNVSGTLIDFFAVHFGNHEDRLDRKLQAERTAEILANSTHPLVMLSYVTSKPYTPEYQRIVDHGNVQDIDPDDKKRFCEYLFYRGLTKVGYARISNGGLSDTEIQIGKFLISAQQPRQQDYIMTHNPEDIPDWIRFPKIFGERKHGHYGNQSHHNYHMNTPKYFYSKEN